MAKSKKKKKKKKSAAATQAATNQPQAVAVAETKVAKKRKAVDKPSVKERTTGTIDKISQFLREVRIELSKVTWPTRKDTIASTSVVLVIVFLIAVFLGIVDLGLSRLMRILLN
ncbi:MAG: preprotein translocase subunit SecE [Deltaproteobacteria bacterium]|nr:preprotein translocase subunit SecE [Deltaproteobacteria bacterium]